MMKWLPGILASTLSLQIVLIPVAAGAAEAFVKIIAPVQGAKLDSMDLAKLVYMVEPGPKGDHVHVYVDSKEVGILRQLKGSYTLEALAPGKHALCVKIVNKAHVPIGTEKCISVNVE